MKCATQQRLRHVVVTSSTWQAQFEPTGIATNVPCLKAITPLKLRNLRIISPQLAMFDAGTTFLSFRWEISFKAHPLVKSLKKSSGLGVLNGLTHHQRKHPLLNRRIPELDPNLKSTFLGYLDVQHYNYLKFRKINTKLGTSSILFCRHHGIIYVSYKSNVIDQKVLGITSIIA